MDISGFTNNIGVVIIGGVIVITVAYFVFKPKPDNKISEKKGVDGVPQANKASTTIEAVNDQPSSPMKETRRFLLDKMRSLKKPDILSGKSREDNDRSADAEEVEMPSETELSIENKSDVSLDVKEGDEENMKDITESEAVDEAKTEIPLSVSSMSLEDINPDFKEIENTDENEPPDDSDSPETDMRIESTDDETEADTTQLEAAVEEGNKENNDQPPEKPKGGGGVFDLFTEVEEEENEISKFAAKLDPVDINDLLQEAREIHKHIRR
jgi:hypothetical protein